MNEDKRFFLIGGAGMRLDMTTPDYRPWSYVRESFRGVYTLFEAFRYFDLYVVHKRGRTFWRDDLVNAMLAESAIDAETFKTYEKAVENTLKNLEVFWDASVEDFYLHFHKLRKQCISPEQLKKHRDKQLENALSTRTIPTELNVLTYPVTKSAVLVYISDYRLLPDVLDDLAGGIVSGVIVSGAPAIYLLAGDDATSQNASRNDIEALLRNPRFQALAAMLKDGTVTILDHKTQGRSLDFREIASNAALQQSIDSRSALLLGYGEGALLAVKDLKIPSVICTNAVTVYGKSVLHCFEETAPWRSVYVPDEFNIFNYVPIVEAPLLTYAHLERLRETHGRSVYSEPIARLRENNPAVFMNLYSDMPEADAETYSGLPVPYTHWTDVYQSLTDRITALAPPMSQRKEIKVEIYRSGTLLCNVLRVSSSEQADVMVIDSYNGMSFRSYMRERELLNKPVFFTNFMFFMTQYVHTLYNSLRKNRPKEQIPQEVFHIDFYLKRDGKALKEPAHLHSHHNNAKAGQCIQTFPLYNKTCIAKDKDGRFLFFRYRLGAGEIQLSGSSVKWEKADVDWADADRLEADSPDTVSNTDSYSSKALTNKTACDERTIVYTPYITCADEALPPKEYQKEVGHSRINIVIIGEKVRAIREGEVLLPSVGVVVSMPKTKGRALMEKLGQTAGADGYYPTESISLHIKLDPPETVPQEIWQGLQWAYGGAIALMRDGVSIFDRDMDPNESFRDEGWLSPLSKQTQESEIQDQSFAAPRTVLGIAESGELLVFVFSGRSKASLGATYRQACQLARLYAPGVSHLLAVDGGASSFVGFAAGGSFHELNYPAGTDDSPTGLVRNVSSVLVL